MELLQGEVFKPLNVEGYEKYLVSNKGRVWNGKIFMKKLRDKNGYETISLCSNGKKKKLKLHRMLGLTFKFDTYKEGLIINHIDNNPRNNDLENLEWVTYKENTLHAIKSGNIDIERLRKQSHSASMKSKEKISKPLEVYHEGIYTIYESISDCHLETGLHFNTIKKILNGERTYTKGYEIEYV